MDVFEGPYYRINKFLLTCLGQWPYQNPWHRRFIRTLIFFVAVSIIVPEVNQVMHIWGDMDHVIESGSMFGVQMSISMKYINYVLNGDKVKLLTDRIYKDWKRNFVGPQLEIMKTHAEKGRKLTEFYSVYMAFTLTMYLFMPVVPKLLDYLMPLNESRIVTLPMPTRYGDLDEDKYYLVVMLHADWVSVITIGTVVAMDSTYAVYVQHACGLFAAVGDRLERLAEPSADGEISQLEDKRQEELVYQEVVTCVKMHKDAIEYSEQIESGHYVLFFFTVGLTVFCMSVAGYQMITNLNKPNEALRFACFTIAQVAHIFFISWPGQKLMDHSEKIHEWTYAARWYDVSNRTKKLLLLMMLRSEEPCKLTAGKFYIMSFANFSMIIRTSVSYFTVLTSFQ